MTELNLEETGRRVKKIREALNLTKAAFSTKMSLSLNTTLLLEKGEHKCLYDFVYNLSVIFKVNLNYLFYGKGGFFARHSGQPDNHFVPGEPADNYEELLWYLRRSKFMRNAVFEFLSKYLYNNEGFIKKDIEKHKYKRIIPKLEHELFDLSLLGDFGKRVRKIREHVKLTQQQFADAIKKSRSNIIKIENGKVKSGFDVLFSIINVFDVTPYYLIHGIGAMFKRQSAALPGGKAIGDAVESLEQLQWYLETSPLVLYATISQAIKIQYENESVILKDLENYGSRD